MRALKDPLALKKCPEDILITIFYIFFIFVLTANLPNEVYTGSSSKRAICPEPTLTFWISFPVTFVTPECDCQPHLLLHSVYQVPFLTITHAPQDWYTGLVSQFFVLSYMLKFYVMWTIFKECHQDQ